MFREKKNPLLLPASDNGHEKINSYNSDVVWLAIACEVLNFNLLNNRYF